MISFSDVFSRFTGAFTKNPDSSIGKIIGVITGEYTNITDTLFQIESWRDVRNAKGRTLDIIGRSFGQERGKATDEVMRLLILAKIARNHSKGTFDSMIEGLAITLNVSPTEIKMVPMYNHPTDPEPAAIMIRTIPITALNKAGLTAAQFGFIAQRIAPLGVRVTSIDLRGTFRMSRIADEIETGANGFSNTQQTSGGTLSAIFDPSKDNDLPI